MLTPASFLNEASLKPGVSFGSLATIEAEGLVHGLNLPPESCYASGGFGSPMPARMAGIEVLFSGWIAPIFSVCRKGGDVGQVTVQVPFELAPAAVSVVVRTGLGTDDPLETVVDGVQILSAAPGIFEQTMDGSRIALLLRTDGTPVSPASPARKGESLRLLATGLGPVLPEARTNQVGVPGQVPFFRPQVQVGDREAEVITAEYAKNLIGVFVVTFRVPADAPGGAQVPLLLKMVESETKVHPGAPSRLPVE
jgi:uncharacterized protein (TIGR03437 family)